MHIRLTDGQTGNFELTVNTPDRKVALVLRTQCKTLSINALCPFSPILSVIQKDNDLQG